LGSGDGGDDGGDAQSVVAVNLVSVASAHLVTSGQATGNLVRWASVQFHPSVASLFAYLFATDHQLAS
jgi:hypothetical protein